MPIRVHVKNADGPCHPTTLDMVSLTETKGEAEQQNSAMFKEPAADFHPGFRVEGLE